MLSRPLNQWRCSSSLAVIAFIRQLIDELDAEASRSRKRRPEDLLRQEVTLTTLLLDLFSQRAANPERYIKVQLNRSEYSSKTTKRYRNPNVTYKPVKSAITFLEQRGWIEVKPGFFDRARKRGACTAIRAADALIDLMKLRGITTQDVETDPTAVCIILKEKKDRYGRKSLLPYSDTDATCALRSTLQRLNAFCTEHQVSLDVSPEELEELQRQRLLDQLEADERKDKDVPRDIDFTRTCMKRVFNNSSFLDGGRFYGPWWQSVPSALRDHILIDGETTVELDYSGMHPRMLYQLAGIDIPEAWDPYDIPGLEDIPRSVKKAVFNQLINGKDHLKMDFKTSDRRAFGISRCFQEGAELIMNHHRPIKDSFLSGEGVRLQYMDSQIAERVMVTLMNEGILALCIHDSFIVPSSHEDALKQAMNEAYIHIIGYRPIIK